MLRQQAVNSYAWYMQLPISKRVILTSFSVWLLQAIPKWGFVLMGDGEVAASLMTLFITPRSELQFLQMACF